MIIEVVVFFIWVFIVIIAGAFIVLGKRRRNKHQAVENIDPGLSFPQRNWLLLCLLIAVVSPLLVSGISTLAHRRMHAVSTQQNGTAYQSDDTTRRDTSYHVAQPPGQTSPGQAAAGQPSSGQPSSVQPSPGQPSAGH